MWRTDRQTWLLYRLTAIAGGIITKIQPSLNKLYVNIYLYNISSMTIQEDRYTNKITVLFNNLWNNKSNCVRNYKCNNIYQLFNLFSENASKEKQEMGDAIRNPFGAIIVCLLRTCPGDDSDVNITSNSYTQKSSPYVLY